MASAFEQFNLKGKTALITGGATGLGYDMAKALAKSGATVMLAARRAEVLKAAAEKLMQEPDIGTVLWQRVDLNDRASVKELTRHAVAAMGGVDIFIGNAGAVAHERIDDITDDAMEQEIRVNLTANIELTRDLLPQMRKKKWGRFIYSSSRVSLGGSANEKLCMLGVTKAGLNALAKYVAAEAGRDGITANALLIGPFMTDILQGTFDSFDEASRQAFTKRLSAMSCVGRPGNPNEITGLVQLLASAAGNYITGALIPIDGGSSALINPVPV